MQSAYGRLSASGDPAGPGMLEEGDRRRSLFPYRKPGIERPRFAGYIRIIASPRDRIPAAEKCWRAACLRVTRGSQS